MQIRLLFPFVPRAPPPSSGIHCIARYKYINNNIRGGSLFLSLLPSLAISLFGEFDIIIVWTRADSINEDYATATLGAGQTVVEHLYTYRAASIGEHSLYGPRKRGMRISSVLTSMLNSYIG